MIGARGGAARMIDDESTASPELESALLDTADVYEQVAQLLLCVRDPGNDAPLAPLISQLRRSTWPPDSP